ncbi:MAG: MCE family protein, partial [Solirubrobacterales bacterium]|nr:MCE family protein [Solirubrobacterales bacterium]
KQAPSVGQMIAIAGFALSCFGLLLFVWVAFGGPTPLAARGYEVKLPLTQVGQLAEQSEVDISGVEVGRVKSIDLGEGDEEGSAIVTLNLEPEYAPIPKDTRAILRAKSLLGEAYIELTPGDKRDGMLEDGDQLPPAQVAKSVQLDEIFRTFDEKTRQAFMQGAIDNSVAISGRGAALNQTLGILPGTVTSLTDVLQVLNQQDQDVSRLIKNTGVVFDALSKRQGQLSGMIRSTDTVFTTLADRDEQLKDFFRVFPTFLRESRATQDRLGNFSEFATPVVRKLIPVARQLSPTFQASARLAPLSERLYTNLKPVIRKAPKAFPSLRAFLDDDAPTLLARIPDYFAEFNPFLKTASIYRKELAATIGNAAAATNAGGQYGTDPFVHYLRAGVRLGPDSYTGFPSGQTSARTNPYTSPGSNLDIASGGMKVFNSANCSAGTNATIQPYSSLTPVQQAQFGVNLRYGFSAAYQEQLYDQLIEFLMKGNGQTNDVPASPCSQQSPFTPIGDSSQPATQYLHVFRQP